MQEMLRNHSVALLDREELSRKLASLERAQATSSAEASASSSSKSSKSAPPSAAAIEALRVDLQAKDEEVAGLTAAIEQAAGKARAALLGISSNTATP